MQRKARVLVLGCNFAGLTISRYLHQRAMDAIEITVIDRKNFVNFIPNIPIEVFHNHNPADNLELPFLKFLKSDGTTFIQAEIEAIDAEKRKVVFKPNERDGSPQESISYDYLVVAVGCKLAFDKIEGFAEYGHTFSDSYYGNKVREFLHHQYSGGASAAIVSVPGREPTSGCRFLNILPS